MLDVMTVDTKRFKVHPIERNGQIAYILGVYVPFMVDYARKTATPLTNVMLTGHVRRLRIVPCPAVVESARIILRHNLLPLAVDRPRSDRQHLQNAVDGALELVRLSLFGVIPQRQ